MEIPEFCKISQEQRKAAWERNPPKPMAFIQTEEPEVIRARREAEKKASYERLAKMKAKKAPSWKEMDHTDMVWNQRRGRWEVPPALPTNIEDTAGSRARAGYARSIKNADRDVPLAEKKSKTSRHAGVNRVAKTDKDPKGSGRKLGGRLARRKR